MNEKQKKFITYMYIFLAVVFMCLVAHDVVKGYCGSSFKIRGQIFGNGNNYIIANNDLTQVIVGDSLYLYSGNGNTGYYFNQGTQVGTWSLTGNIQKWSYSNGSWVNQTPNATYVSISQSDNSNVHFYSNFNAAWYQYTDLMSTSTPNVGEPTEFSSSVPYVDVNSIDNDDGSFTAIAWVNDVRANFANGDKIYIDCYWRVPNRATADAIVSARQQITSGSWVSSVSPLTMSSMRSYWYSPIYDNTTLITVNLDTMSGSDSNQYLNLQINKEKFVYDIHNADVNHVYGVYQSADWASNTDNVDLCVRLGYMYRLDIYVMRGNLQGPKTTLLFDTNGKKLSGGNINKLASEITPLEEQSNTQAITQRAISELQDQADFRQRQDVDITTTEITDSWEDIVEAVKGSSEVVLVIPLLMSYLFSWLPGGLGAIISFGVTSIVVISIYKALRG